MDAERVRKVKVIVSVTLKEQFTDVKGAEKQRALRSLDYEEVAAVREGQLIELELELTGEDDPELIVREMCQKLLCNPVTSRFQLVIIYPEGDS